MLATDDYLPVAPEQSRSFRLVDLKSRGHTSVSTPIQNGQMQMAAWMKHPYVSLAQQILTSFP